MNQIIEYSSLINTDPFLLFFGSFFLVLGLSCFFAKNAWEEFVMLFADHNSLSLIMGILILPISLSILAFYQPDGSLAAKILVFVGWIALIKATILLIRPSIMQTLISKQFVSKWLWLDGISGILLGLVILFL